MKPNGLAYAGDNPAYKEKCSSRTSNETYINTIDSVAVINIKKIGGGKRADSILSEAGKYYTEHLTPELLNILVEQIDFIEPSIIVLCCGPAENSNIERTLKPYFESVQFVKSYHPSYWRITDKAFCQNALDGIICDSN